MPPPRSPLEISDFRVTQFCAHRNLRGKHAHYSFILMLDFVYYARLGTVIVVGCPSITGPI